MATVYLTFSAGEQIRGGLSGLIVKGNYSRSEAVTSSSTTAQGALVAKAGETFVKVQSPAQAIAVTAGENPTATLAGGAVVTSGGSEYVSVKLGDKIAVIDI
jgi:hypothetical protein